MSQQFHGVSSESGSPDYFGTASDSHTAFDRLHVGVQRQLWRMGWAELRPLQVQTIHAVVGTDRNVVLSAATASGKTEAAFLPILSNIASETQGSVQALYVGPLRALINDQFARIEDLCHYLEVPVHRWHSDVDARSKANLIKHPGGVLLLTPESLESLFVNRSWHLFHLFEHLRFVVVDELHSFLGTERGLHLQSLICRLRQEVCRSGRPCFRVIGLSATISDEHAAAQFVSPTTPDDVAVIRDDTPKELRYRLHAYRDGIITDILGRAGQNQEAASIAERRAAADIYRQTAGHTCLIFVNRRGDAEVFADLCQEMAVTDGTDRRFVVHHGSLAHSFRKDAEELLKSNCPVTAFCTSTLELGIDLGNVRMVGQIGAPWAVASLRQRLGRSGRRDGEARILRSYVMCQEIDASSDLFERLRLPLVQSIAVTQLMLAGWIEPVPTLTCELSTLTQQVLSVIAQTGGIPAEALFDRLCTQGAFSGVQSDLFVRLLRRLGAPEVDAIEQAPSGELILGLQGERIRQSKEFYAVFVTSEDYALMHNGRSLGSLPVDIPPPLGAHLVFAGRRWRVIDVEIAQRIIYVDAAQVRMRPSFAGPAGEVATRVRLVMREVLRGPEQYLYLDAEADSLLEEARRVARATGTCEASRLQLGRAQCALLTWVGSRTQATLQAMLHEAGVPSQDRGIGLLCEATTDRLRSALEAGMRRRYDPETLARHVLHQVRRKYDSLLGDDLRAVSLARDYLDLDSAYELIGNLMPALE